MKRRQGLALALGSLSCLGGLPAAIAQGRAERVVCVGGALTETVFALGAQAALVGVDSTSLHPAQARDLPTVGYLRSLAAEGVLSLRPSLLLAAAEAGPPAVLQQLRATGLRVELLDEQHRFEGVLARTQRIAELMQRPEQGLRLQQQLRQQWAALPAPAQPAPRVLFVLAHGGGAPRVAGEGTGADAMLQLAGARNALAGMQGYKALTPEGALQAAPDCILCTDQGLQAVGGAEALLKAPGLALTPAGRAGRLLSMDALLLLGFGPRLPLAVKQLREALNAQASHARTA